MVIKIDGLYPACLTEATRDR